MLIRLTKIKEREDAKHPRNISVGFEKYGIMVSEPEVGETFWIGTSFRTSPVTRIIDENTFETMNSIYHIERNAVEEEWKVGNHPSIVVSNKKVRNSNFPTPPNPEESRDEDMEHYGGYMICESIGNPEHAKLIAQALNFKRALEAIVNPVQYLQIEAEKEGSKLNGHMAVYAMKDPQFYIDIARKALDKLKE